MHQCMGLFQCLFVRQTLSDARRRRVSSPTTVKLTGYSQADDHATRSTILMLTCWVSVEWGSAWVRADWPARTDRKRDPHRFRARLRRPPTGGWQPSTLRATSSPASLGFVEITQIDMPSIFSTNWAALERGERPRWVINRPRQCAPPRACPPWFLAPPPQPAVERSLHRLFSG